jgi:hypothetical protein
MLTAFEDRMPFQKNGSSILKSGDLVLADVLKLDELLKRRKLLAPVSKLDESFKTRRRHCAYLKLDELLKRRRSSRCCFKT